VKSLGLIVATGVLAAAGCCHTAPHAYIPIEQASFQQSAAWQLQTPRYDEDVRAVITPPIDWRAERLKTSGHHKHQVWLSPTGCTAYGVLHFFMPLPVGQQLALLGFMSQMKRSEGEAFLLSQQPDANLPGIRFVAEGGRYKIRANLSVDGWQGWVVYAGTLRGKPVIDDELELAQRAREHTKIGPAK